jgi:hypothetical protein
VPARKEATFLLDANTLFKSIRHKLLESGKEPVVVAARERDRVNLRWSVPVKIASRSSKV